MFIYKPLYRFKEHTFLLKILFTTLLCYTNLKSLIAVYDTPSFFFGNISRQKYVRTLTFIFKFILARPRFILGITENVNIYRKI